MIPKFMGTEGFFWFFGVVEDNNDPLKLGRVKVRCFGLHNDDPNELRTEHLPWATVLQPTTSAAQNGYGMSPTGIRPNTRVFGFFADGAAAQYPLVLATLGGINNGVPIPGLETPLPLEEIQRQLQEEITRDNEVVGVVGPLSESQYREFKEEIRKRESGGAGGDLRARNSFGYVGRYQFGALALNDTGYVKRNITQNSQLTLASSWTGKDGVNNLDNWFNNEAAQENAMLALTRKNYDILVRTGALSTSSTPRRVSGLLAVSHLLGAGGATTYAKTGRGADGNGTSGNVYYRAGYNVITDDSPKVA